MGKRIAFDTLAYAKMLEKNGIEHADVHAAMLAETIVENIYMKHEVDKMIDDALKRFDERTRLMDKQFAEEMLKIHNSIEKIFNRTISILGSLIVIVGASATFAHTFFH